MPATSRPQNKYNLFLRKPKFPRTKKDAIHLVTDNIYAPIYDGAGLYVDYLHCVPPLRTLAVSLSRSGIPSNSQMAAYYTVLRDVPLPLMDSRQYRIYWEAELIADAPELYVLDKTAVVVGHELRAPEVTRLDKVTSEVSAPRQITDVNTLLHVNRVSVWPEQQTYWQAHRYP